MGISLTLVFGVELEGVAQEAEVEVAVEGFILLSFGSCAKLVSGLGGSILGCSSGTRLVNLDAHGANDQSSEECGLGGKHFYYY